MARRPPTVPQWGTAAAPGRLVEPIEAKRRGGFDDAERPPAPWVNWMLNLVGAWVDFLRAGSLSNWERTTLAANIVSADVDVTTPPDVVPLRRVVGVDDSNGHHVWASVRGNEWVQRTVTFSTGYVDNLRCVVWTGSLWLFSAVNGGTTPVLGYTTADPFSSSAIKDPTVGWTQAVTPGGMTEVDALAARVDPVTGAPLGVVAVSQDKILYSTDVDGATFANATTVGTPAGAFDDVLWTGSGWVAITDHGEVWTAAFASGSWTRAAVLTTASPPYARRLASDGLGTVLAYPDKVATADDWWVSTDGGATWSAQTAPPDLTHITRVRVLQGVWILTCNDAPYLATANDPGTDAWIGMPIPIPDSSLATPSDYDLQEIVYVDGAFVALGEGHWLLSRRAEDVSPGGYAPQSAPLYLHDAAYIRGVLCAGGAPSDGQVYRYNAGTNQFELTTLTSGGSVVQADTIETFTPSGDLTVKIGNASNKLVWETGGGAFIAQLDFTGCLSWVSGETVGQPGLLLPNGDGIWWRQTGGGHAAAFYASGDDILFSTIGVNGLAYLSAARAFVVRDGSLNEKFRVATSGTSAGGVGVGTGGDPKACAILELASTSRAFLPTRMTTTQRDAMTTALTLGSGDEGLEFYNLTLHKKQLWNGSAWETVTSV